jgi:hypothetical protein
MVIWSHEQCRLNAWARWAVARDPMVIWSHEQCRLNAWARWAVARDPMLIYIFLCTACFFLAHLAFRPGELLPSLFVRSSTFHILIFSSETTGPIATKLWWNGPWMAPLPKLCPVIPTSNQDGRQAKNRRNVGDEILIVHCCFSISQNKLKL